MALCAAGEDEDVGVYAWEVEEFVCLVGLCMVVWEGGDGCVLVREDVVVLSIGEAERTGRR